VLPFVHTISLSLGGFVLLLHAVNQNKTARNSGWLDQAVQLLGTSGLQLGVKNSPAQILF
jgi:hypothetical protein